MVEGSILALVREIAVESAGVWIDEIASEVALGIVN